MHHLDVAPEVPMPVLVYGASGQSFAIAQCMIDEAPPGEKIVIKGFIDDFAKGDEPDYFGIPVYHPSKMGDMITELPILVALGRPSDRRTVVEKVKGMGGHFARIYRETRTTLSHVQIGIGAMISSRSYYGPSSVIGEHVQIMAMCSIGHDVRIGAYSTICPSVVVSGHVVVEEEVFLGAGCIIVEGRAGRPLTIGRGAFVAAGAVVTKSVPPGARVAGNPARPLREFVKQTRAQA
ncbi:MAG: DapH/DapD/GlmU-related protein [Pseudomonadota bacterium]